MITLSVGKFHANMNTFLQLVQKGEVISLHLQGNEIAKIMPPSFAQSAVQQGLERLRQCAFVGDVLSPIDDPWHAASEL